jgi:hypothetical protein
LIPEIEQMAKLVGLFALLLASANAFAPQSAVLRASTRFRQHDD